MEIATISPKEVASQPGFDLIDVRTPAEFAECHAAGAKLVPLDHLNPAELMAGRGEGPLYVICRSGGRARQACEAIQAAGFSNVVNVAGGTLAWEMAGLPVVRGKKTISLERQVRIAAGSLVAIVTALGLFVHPWFLALPAFVGCGQVFAGITDTCGKGMLIARMPWNQQGGSESCPTPASR